MTLREKIAKIVKACGCKPLPTNVQNALVKLVEDECAERARQASVKKPVGKLLSDFSNFLDQKGFEILNPESVHQEASANYRLGRQIFKNRKLLVPFMCNVALSINDGNSLVYEAPSSEDANTLKNFLNGLHKSGHLLTYSVDGNNFKVGLPTEKEKLKFFRSEWAEECFRYVVRKIVDEASKKFNAKQRIFSNVEIARNGDSSRFTEFDIVVQLKDRFYVFEVKSGLWVRIEQWVAREKAFVTKDGPFRVIVCTIHADINCKIFEPQILMNLEDIEKRLSELFAKDLGGRD